MTQQYQQESITDEAMQWEYELILAENEDKVVFQISGRDVEVSRTDLIKYDEEGRFWVSRDTAEKMGLFQDSFSP